MTIEELLDENNRLKAELERLRSGVSDEEIICRTQLNLLKNDALNRALTLEEIKKADYLIKNIFIIKGKPTSSDIKVEYNGKDIKQLTDSELTELVKLNHV